MYMYDLPTFTLGFVFLGVTITWGTVGAFLAQSIFTAILGAAIGYGVNVALSEDPQGIGASGATVETFSAPTSMQGRAIPIIFGTPRMKGMNDVWHGDLVSQPIKKKVKKNAFGNHKNITVGYKYLLGFHYGWCAFAEEILQIRMGEEVIWERGFYADGAYTIRKKRWLREDQQTYIRYNSLLERWELTSITLGVLFYIEVPASEVAIDPTLPATGWTATSLIYGGPITITYTSPSEIEVTGSATETVTENTTLTISREDLFGGKDSQGGVSGDLDIMFGLPTQGANTYLTSVLGTPMPAFRGIVSFVGNRMYIGTTQSLKQMDCILSRTTKDNYGNDIWYDEKAEVISSTGLPQLNPVHIIYELITDSQYSVGIADGIDEANFMEVADTLYDEGYGLSFVFDQSKDAETVIEEISGYFNGMLRRNSVTNQYEIKLLRDDFDIADLAVIDETVITEITSVMRKTANEIYNQVSITYTDPGSREPATLIAQNTALINAFGGVIVNNDLEFPAIHDPELANVLATRALQTTCANPFSAIITGNRDLRQFNFGDPFVLTYGPLGLDSVVVRVIEIDDGELINNKVTLTVMQDVFKAAESIFSTPDESAWVDDKFLPIELTEKRIIELPFYNLARDVLGVSAASLLTAETGRVMSAGVKNVSNNTIIDTYAKVSTATDYELQTNDGIFSPYCTITSALDASPDQIVVGYENEIDMVATLVTISEYAWCEVEGEIMGIVDIDFTAKELTLNRGCLDTIPASHSIGAEVVFMSEVASITQEEYGNGQTVNVKIVPYTTLGEYDVDDVTEDDITINNRYIRPYNGANFQGSGSSNFTFTWEHRNRLLQVQEVIDQFETGITPEPGTTYTFSVKDGTTVVYQETGITGTSAEYTFDDRLNDFGIVITGTTSPDVTGSYAQSGTNDGKPVYSNGTYSIWWDFATTKYYITIDGSVGTIPSDYFSHIFLYGPFVPTGTYTGTPTVAIGGDAATYHLKSVRDGYESWQEWSISFLGTPATMITETGDTMITEVTENEMVTEVI